MTFTGYLRLCLGLGLSIIPFLVLAFGLAWFIEVSALPDLISVGLAFITAVFVVPALCEVMVRAMDLIAPGPSNPNPLEES